MTPRRVDDFLREVQTWEQPVGDGPARRAAERHPRRVRRPRVIVAEDNADLRTYLGDVLGDDYDVELVPDGRAAARAGCGTRPTSCSAT